MLGRGGGPAQSLRIGTSGADERNEIVAPYIPKYVPPKQAAEERAQRRTVLIWIAIAIPLVYALLVFGYSDQAPAFLRSAVITLDKAFGYPLAAWLGVVTTP